MRYLVDLTIDQRPTRREWVSARVFRCFERLGWVADGRVVVVERAL